MKDDSRLLFDDLLIQWHNWSRGYKPIADVGSSPMFHQAKTGRQWDTMDEVIEREIDGDRMASVDFHVGELPPTQRTAIQLCAMNLATGKAVWSSVRLPTDVVERAIVLAGARAALSAKLRDAGIL